MKSCRVVQLIQFSVVTWCKLCNEYPNKDIKSGLVEMVKKILFDPSPTSDKMIVSELQLFNG